MENAMHLLGFARFTKLTVVLTPTHKHVPSEQPSPVWFGNAVHIGPIVISYLLFKCLGSSLTAVLLATLPVSFLALGFAELAAWLRPTVLLAPLTIHSFARGFLWNILGKGIVIGGLSVFCLYNILHDICPL